MSAPSPARFSIQRFFLAVIGCVLVFLGSAAWARASLEEHAQAWGQLIVQGKLVEPIRSYLEIQPRYSLTTGGLDRLLLRPALQTEIAPGLTAWLGYVAVGAFGPSTTWEHRPWQQLQHEHRSESGAVLINRTRLEERLLPGTETVGLRLRHLVRGLIPWGASPDWSLVLSNEIFVNFNAVGAVAKGGLDQNRAFLGVHHKISDSLRLEGGYLNNWVVRPSPWPERVNHTALLTAFVWI
jgi:hypothetical protein